MEVAGVHVDTPSHRRAYDARDVFGGTLIVVLMSLLASVLWR